MVHAPQLLVSQPDVGAGQTERVAQEVDEEEARLDVRLVRLAVDGDGDVLGGHRSAASYAFARARSVARRSALTVISAAIARLYSTGPRTSPAGSALGSRGGAGSAEQLLRRGVADEDRLGVGCGERRLGDARHADAGTRDPAVRLEPDDRRDAHRRKVADLAFELLVGAARRRCGRRAMPDLGQDLGRLDARS